MSKNVSKSLYYKKVVKDSVYSKILSTVHKFGKSLCVPECDGLLVLVVPCAPQLPGLVPDLLHLGIVLHHNGVLKEGAGAGVRAVAVQTILCNIIQRLSLCHIYNFTDFIIFFLLSFIKAP